MHDCDLLIVGGGPAGLSAAINAASEGLSVRLLDAAPRLGGQARESHAIENYPGFPGGITGDALMLRLIAQAHKFGVDMHVPVLVGRLFQENGSVTVLCDDNECHRSRAVLLAGGVQYQRLNVPGCSRLTGAGVYYGLPPHVFTRTRSPAPIGIVGGANSAGQAALALAKANRRVVMFVRTTLESKMSAYLIERIRAEERIHVEEGCELSTCIGDAALTGVTATRACGGTSQQALCALCIFIGAKPKTLWLDGAVSLDDRGFVVTGATAPYMTSHLGVFAAGDLRATSTKRIAGAVGEGVAALQSIHRYLNV